MRGPGYAHKNRYIAAVRSFTAQFVTGRLYRPCSMYALTALLFTACEFTSPRYLSAQLIQNHPRLKTDAHDQSSRTGLLGLWIEAVAIDNTLDGSPGYSSGVRGEAGLSYMLRHGTYLEAGIWRGNAAPVRGFGISLPPDSLGAARSVYESAAYTTLIKEFGKYVEISSSLLFTVSSYKPSYALYGQAKVRMHKSFDIHVGMRPTYDRFNSSWNNGVNVGLTLMPYASNFLTVSLAQTSRREYEPSVRYTAAYELFPTATTWIKTIAETGGGDRHRYSEIGISGGFYATRRLGFSLNLSERRKSLANRQIGAGIVWRQ